MKQIIQLLTLSLIIALTSSVKSGAQSLHFSQNSMIPLLTNPAYTGLFNGDVRVGGIYRSQWSSISANPYKTFAVSADAKILEGLSEGDWVGGGLTFYSDKAGAVSFTNNAVLLTSSYNLNLFGENKNFISLGLQAGANQEKLDLSAAQFDSYYSDGVINPALGVEEDIYNGANYGFLFSLGGMYYRVQSIRNYYFVGASLGRVQGVRKERFEESIDQNSVPLRLSVQAGASFKIARLIDIVPRVYYFKEAGYMKTDLLVGARYIFLENQRTQTLNAFHVAAGFRINKNDASETGLSRTDAFIIQATLEVESITASMAYDINISDLTPSTNRQGAFEIAIMYNIQYRKNQQNRKGPPVYCPRM